MSIGQQLVKALASVTYGAGGVGLGEQKLKIFKKRYFMVINKYA